MLTLFHAPQSRSTRVLMLLEEMGARDRVAVHRVDITRRDGSGARDPANPHPEGKVPALVQDGRVITESVAVMLHLTSVLKDHDMAPPVGGAQWGEYLSWMVWYGSVMEPVLILEMTGISNPALSRNFRGVAEVDARLRGALDKGPWILGETFSAADLLLHSPHIWLGKPHSDPVIQDWIARCQARPATLRVLAEEAALGA